MPNMTDQAQGQAARCQIEDPRFCLGARCRLTDNFIKHAQSGYGVTINLTAEVRTER